MKIPLAFLKPNPFRDFALYPLDDEQVERLSHSISELGFFAGVSARQVKDGYELAAGHHRVEAARHAGLIAVDATVKAYTDLQMVQIMANENLTQRGHQATATVDSVAAFCRIVAKWMLIEGSPAEQTKVAQDGPDREMLNRAINGDRGTKILTSTEISQTLAALKASGRMAKIVADALGEVKQPPREHVEAVAKQAAEKPIYDLRVASAFRLTSHEAAFREAVTSENGLRFIPVDRQYDLALHIRAQIDVLEKRRGQNLGSPSVTAFANSHIAEAIRAQTNLDREEKSRLLAVDAIANTNKKWTQLVNFSTRAVRAMEELVELESDWDYSAGAFPLDTEALRLVERIPHQLEQFRKRWGLKKGTENGIPDDRPDHPTDARARRQISDKRQP